MSTNPGCVVKLVWCILLFCGLASVPVVLGDAPSTGWLDELVGTLQPGAASTRTTTLQLVRQDHEQLESGQSVIQTPIRVGKRSFTHGLGTHSVSRIRIVSQEPIARLTAWVGVDANDRTQGGQGSVEFTVTAGAKGLYRSKVLRGGEEPERVDVDLGGAKEIELNVGDAGDGPACDHADWADAEIVLADGRKLWLDELPRLGGSADRSPYPFSFLIDGKPSSQVLAAWTRRETKDRLDAERTRETLEWADPSSGLRVTCEIIRYIDFPAAEWLLYFANTGQADTPIIEGVRSLDIGLESPLPNAVGYRLYRTLGGPASPADFEPSVLTIDTKTSAEDGCRRGPFIAWVFPVLQDRRRPRFAAHRGRLVGHVERRSRHARRAMVARDRRPGADPLPAASGVRRSVRRVRSCLPGKARHGKAMPAFAS